MLLDEAASGAAGSERTTLAAAADALRQGGSVEAALDADLAALVQRHAGASGGHAPRAAPRGRRRPRPGPLRRVVRAVPALVRRLRRGAARAAQAGRAGLRRALPAAGPPDRPHEPQGRQQHAGRRRRRPRQPVGDRRRARRPRGDPPRPGHVRRLRRAGRGRPRARHRDRAGLRDPVLGRPPVADRASRVVQPPPGRHAQVRREPAQALPGHLQRQLEQRGLAGAVAGAARRPARLGRPRRDRLPRRQPAHQADRLLALADHRDPPRPPRGDLPRRGVHAPLRHARAGQERLQPVLHVLHLEERALGARRVPRPSWPTPRRRSTSGPTSSSTRRTSSPTTSPRAGRPPSRCGSSSPPR